jgi:DNA-binding NtrC family response regulator
MSKLRALIVEDCESDAKLVVREIKRRGLDVEARRVEDAASMREALAAESWNVILCDWSLPSFNALAALQIVKESGLDIPFIIVSGTMGEEMAVEAIRAGAHDYLLKDRLTRLVPSIERELREARPGWNASSSRPSYSRRRRWTRSVAWRAALPTTSTTSSR